MADGGSTALQQLYAEPRFRAVSWPDPADHAYIGIHLIERSIAALASRLHGDLLDVGCGRQPYRPYFQHMLRYVGCDHDASRGTVDFACPAHAIPTPDGSFDAILCTEVLEHVPDPLAVWKEFQRVLRPGGRVLLTTPMYWPSHEVPYDYYRFPEHGLRYLTAAAGFEVEELWPRGGMWALLGQVVMHVMGHYFPLPFMRRGWNRLMLAIDRSRKNPMITLGWTILAQKRPPI
jgi:SAM-dependent methyltransferase